MKFTGKQGKDRCRVHFITPVRVRYLYSRYCGIIPEKERFRRVFSCTGTFRDNDHRELKSLGCMDGHDIDPVTDRVFGLALP